MAIWSVKDPPTIDLERQKFCVKFRTDAFIRLFCVPFTDIAIITEKITRTMTAAGSPRKKEEKSREDKINEIMADGATAVKMEVDYRCVLGGGLWWLRDEFLTL